MRPADAIWQNKTYLRLFIAQVISLLGTGVSTICLGLLAWELSHELALEDASIVLGTVFALKMVVYVCFAPFVGQLFAPFDRKKVLITLDCLRGVIILCLPFVTQVWQVYVLTFVINMCAAAFTPLYQSILPAVIHNEKDYTKALSFSRLAFDLEQLISPILTAVLLTLVSYKALFMLDALTFAVSAFLIFGSVLPRTLLSPANYRHFSLQGIRGYLAHPKLRSLWFAYLAVASASAMVIVNTVIYVHDVLSGGQTETALAMMIVGGGSIVVALSLPKWLENHSVRMTQLTGIVLLCLSMTIGSLAPDWVGFIVLCFLSGMGLALVQTPAALVITKQSDETTRNDLFAAHFSLTHFWWFFTYLFAGWSASQFGLATTYAVMMLLCLVSLACYLISTRETDLVATM